MPPKAAADQPRKRSHEQVEKNSFEEAQNQPLPKVQKKYLQASPNGKDNASRGTDTKATTKRADKVGPKNRVTDLAANTGSNDNTPVNRRTRAKRKEDGKLRGEHKQEQELNQEPSSENESSGEKDEHASIPDRNVRGMTEMRGSNAEVKSDADDDAGNIEDQESTESEDTEVDSEEEKRIPEAEREIRAERADPRILAKEKFVEAKVKQFAVEGNKLLRKKLMQIIPQGEKEMERLIEADIKRKEEYLLTIGVEKYKERQLKIIRNLARKLTKTRIPWIAPDLPNKSAPVEQRKNQHATKAASSKGTSSKESGTNKQPSAKPGAEPSSDTKTRSQAAPMNQPSMPPSRVTPITTTGKGPSKHGSKHSSRSSSRRAPPSRPKQPSEPSSQKASLGTARKSSSLHHSKPSHESHSHMTAPSAAKQLQPPSQQVPSQQVLPEFPEDGLSRRNSGPSNQAPSGQAAKSNPKQLAQSSSRLALPKNAQSDKLSRNGKAQHASNNLGVAANGEKDASADGQAGSGNAPRPKSAFHMVGLSELPGTIAAAEQLPNPSPWGLSANVVENSSSERSRGLSNQLPSVPAATSATVQSSKSVSRKTFLESAGTSKPTGNSKAQHTSNNLGEARNDEKRPSAKTKTDTKIDTQHRLALPLNIVFDPTRMPRESPPPSPLPKLEDDKTLDGRGYPLYIDYDDLEGKYLFGIPLDLYGYSPSDFDIKEVCPGRIDKAIQRTSLLSEPPGQNHDDKFGEIVLLLEHWLKNRLLPMDTSTPKKRKRQHDLISNFVPSGTLDSEDEERNAGEGGEENAWMNGNKDGVKNGEENRAKAGGVPSADGKARKDSRKHILKQKLKQEREQLIEEFMKVHADIKLRLMNYRELRWKLREFHQVGLPALLAEGGRAMTDFAKKHDTPEGYDALEEYGQRTERSELQDAFEMAGEALLQEAETSREGYDEKRRQYQTCEAAKEKKAKTLQELDKCDRGLQELDNRLRLLEARGVLVEPLDQRPAINRLREIHRYYSCWRDRYDVKAQLLEKNLADLLGRPPLPADLNLTQYNISGRYYYGLELHQAFLIAISNVRAGFNTIQRLINRQGITPYPFHLNGLPRGAPPGHP